MIYSISQEISYSVGQEKKIILSIYHKTSDLLFAHSFKIVFNPHAYMMLESDSKSMICQTKIIFMRNESKFPAAEMSFTTFIWNS